MNNQSRIILWAGILLILITGMIHVIDAKDSFSDAVYKGWLFYINGAASLFAAFGIYQRKDWGWNLSLMIAIGSILGYVASRTVGLPYIPAEPDAWFEPLGVTAMVSELLFVIVFIGKRLTK